MELIETIVYINTQLIRHYHYHEDGRAKFRVVFANDQFEKRWTDFTPEGFRLIHPEVRELPKYLDDYCRDKFILEQLSIVPESDQELTEKLSYEPLWVFRDRFNNYMPPKFEVCKIVIDSMYKNLGIIKPPVKEDSPEIIAKKDKELRRIEEELFGNETPVGDGLAYGWSSVVPGSDDKTKLGGISPEPKEEKVN